MGESFKGVRKFKNLYGKTMHKGWYKTPSINLKTHIIIHHSLTKEGDSEAFARYHVGTLGWPEVAYHFVILKDGTVEWNHDLNVKSYHVGNHNNYCIGVCLVGDFRTEEPTDEQKKSLRDLYSRLVKDLPNYKATLGHSELSGYEWKSCPCFDYKAVLKAVEKPKTQVKGVNNVEKREYEKATKSLAKEWKIAHKHGLTDGDEPNETITRAECAAMIVRALELK